MQITRIASKACAWILLPAISASLLFTHDAVAQGTRTMTVLGSIEGTIDGFERSWLTITGEVEGRNMSTAAWRPHSMADMMEAVLDGMSEQQRARMAQMFGGDGEEEVALRIMGVDPEAEKILRQGGLTIELPPFSADNVDQMLGGRNEAEISYHKNFGEQRGFFVSSHDVGIDATVGFDRLEIVTEGGVAEGTFEGSLCPIRSLMGSNPSLEGCILVEGHFETELGEEEADNPQPSAAG